MNSKFNEINKTSKVDIKSVISYYDEFGTTELSPDDEFGEYILSKKK